MKPSIFDFSTRCWYLKESGRFYLLTAGDKYMEVLAVSLALYDTMVSGTDRIRTAIESAGGVITQARQLSSWAIALTVEILGHKLCDFDARLTQCGAVWLGGTESRLRARASELVRTSSHEIAVLMHIELINDDPERRLIVPAVPG
jgi:hypothetical protein